jgi:tellurite resistance protein TerC
MITAWALFIVFVLFLLAIDLGVFHRTPHAVGFRESLAWSALWLTLGVAFSLVVFVGYEHQVWGLGTRIDPVDGAVNDGATAVEKYLTGYLVEKSLSVDNIFVISTIFASMAVPALYQHRVLFWGVIGALAMRGVMIVVGARLIEEFHWLLTVFAGFLIVTALKMLWMKDTHGDPRTGWFVGCVTRLVPVASDHRGERFLVWQAGAGGRATLALTPLALALALVEAADLVFAIDSIPAIFAITGDPFLVFTSNVFAMLGLRSLYFALAGMVEKFRYLKPALALVLLLVGGKMLAAEWLKHVLGDHFNLYLLLAVAGVISGGVVLSLLVDRPDAERRRSPRRETGRADGAVEGLAAKSHTLPA